MKGILLIASGQPFYGRMAYNLAVTIKAVEEIPVTVLHNGAGLSHLSEKQKGIFDQVIEIKPSAFAAKLSLYDYSPYTETLYFDADMVWLPGRYPSQLFDELKEVSFTSITEGFYDYETSEDQGNKMYHYWCDLNEAKEKYKLSGKYYQWRSEVIYFKKGSIAKKLFDEAKKVYQNPKVDAKKFAGHIPDELAINIAACKQGLEPHKLKWTPAYWHRLHGEGRGLSEIVQNYYLMSAGGNYASGVMKDCYNRVCKAAHNKLRLQYLFTLQSKKAVLPERIKM